MTYASRYGSATGVTEVIGQSLAENGFQVGIRRMDGVNDLSAHDAIVAGSEVQRQKWLPAAMQFRQTYKQILFQKPFAVFLVCITPGMKTWIHAAGLCPLTSNTDCCGVPSTMYHARYRSAGQFSHAGQPP